MARLTLTQSQIVSLEHALALEQELNNQAAGLEAQAQALRNRANGCKNDSFHAIAQDHGMESMPEGALLVPNQETGRFGFVDVLGHSTSVRPVPQAPQQEPKLLPKEPTNGEPIDSEEEGSDVIEPAKEHAALKR